VLDRELGGDQASVENTGTATPSANSLRWTTWLAVASPTCARTAMSVMPTLIAVLP
jgi:hypothetical protein